MARFLIVDDDAPSVKGMARLLRDDGHTVASFTEGAKALEALAGEPFDAVVTDLQMADVDGHEIVRATRRRLPEACLVVVSSRAGQHEKKLAEEGACIVVDKPIDYDEVMGAIGECLARRGPGTHGHCQMRSKASSPTPAKLRGRPKR